MVYIDIPRENDSIGRVNLTGRQYYIRFTWMRVGGYWCFSLYNEKMEPLLGMTRMVPFSPLNNYYTYDSFPQGVFAVTTRENGEIKKDSFWNGDAKFVFLELEEGFNPYE